MTTKGDVFNEYSDVAASNKEPLKPIWFENAYKTDKKTIKWFRNTLPILEELAKDRIAEYKNNLCWYMGWFDQTQEYTFRIPNNRDVVLPKRIMPVVISHLTDLTEQHVSHLSQFKPNVYVGPANNEHRDKVSADLGQMVVKYINQKNQFEELMQRLQRWKRVFGEIYLDIGWDKSIGDKDDKGNPIGDVCYRIKEPWFVFPEPKRHWREVSYVIDIEEIIHIEEARKKFNKPNLKPSDSCKIYGFADAEDEKREEEVIVYRVQVKPSEFIPEGVVIRIVSDEVVERTKVYPYTHNDFSFECLTDIDAPARLHGQSWYNILRPIQHQYNKTTSLISRNLFLVAHPKILMPEGAAKIESMTNRATVVTYRGPTAPQIVNFAANPSEAYAFRDKVLQELQQISGEHGVSRGTPPPGIRAGIALQFLEEQERKGRNTHITKHNNFIKRVTRKALGVFSDYTKEDDGRLIRILGKNNQYQIQDLRGTKLSGPFDVQIQNTTAFSESFAGRISQIIELNREIPGLLTREQMADMLEFGQVDKFYDITTAALRSAESENEDILSGKEVGEPEPFEDLVVHWTTHMIPIQTRYFKENVPDPIRESLLDHIAQTEILMEEKAVANPAFAQVLQQLAGFPAFLVQKPQIAPPPQDPGIPPGGQGDLAGALPGEEPLPQGEVPVGEAPPGGDLPPLQAAPPDVQI